MFENRQRAPPHLVGDAPRFFVAPVVEARALVPSRASSAPHPGIAPLIDQRRLPARRSRRRVRRMRDRGNASLHRQPLVARALEQRERGDVADVAARPPLRTACSAARKSPSLDARHSTTKLFALVHRPSASGTPSASAGLYRHHQIGVFVWGPVAGASMRRCSTMCHSAVSENAIVGAIRAVVREHIRTSESRRCGTSVHGRLLLPLGGLRFLDVGEVRVEAPPDVEFERLLRRVHDRCAESRATPRALDR